VQTVQDEQNLIGTVIADRYRLLKVLGVGGMGAVYLAEHARMHKRVALKLLHPEMVENPEVVARFEREAMAAAHIEHPNVAAALDFGQSEDGAFFMVLEYLEGKSLRDILEEQGAFDVERMLKVSRQIVAALIRAHALGIVHRDLKPENVMLVQREGENDFVKVLDFGIAKVPVNQLAGDQTKKAEALTRMGVMYGTPQYMPPEQILGREVDARADLYALGIMMYEMLTGKPPFESDNPVALVTKHLTEAFPALNTRMAVSHLPRDLEPMLEQLLQKEPETRMQSAQQLLEIIDRMAAGTPAPPTLQQMNSGFGRGAVGGNQGPMSQAAPSIAYSGQSGPSSQVLSQRPTHISQTNAEIVAEYAPQSVGVASEFPTYRPPPSSAVQLNDASPLSQQPTMMPGTAAPVIVAPGGYSPDSPSPPPSRAMLGSSVDARTYFPGSNGEALEAPVSVVVRQTPGEEPPGSVAVPTSMGQVGPAGTVKLPYATNKPASPGDQLQKTVVDVGKKIGDEIDKIRQKLPNPYRQLPIPVFAMIPVVLFVSGIVITLMLAMVFRSPSKPGGDPDKGGDPTKQEVVQRSVTQEEIESAAEKGAKNLEGLYKIYPKEPRILRRLVKLYTDKKLANHAMGALKRWSKVEAKIAAKPIAQDALRLALVAESESQEEAFSLLTNELGEAGIDFLFEISNDNTMPKNVRSHAKKLVHEPENIQKASPPLRVMIEMEKARSCGDKRKLLSDVQKHGDKRVLPHLKRLKVSRGCGFLGMSDCWSCMRKGRDLDQAIKAIETREKEQNQAKSNGPDEN
jgi:serine/threonine protein kinase